MKRAVVVVLSCALALSAAGQRNNELAFTADPKRVDIALAHTEQAAPSYAAELAERQRASQPLFIIVPGILGSKLVNERGEIFWGEKGLLSGFHREDLELTSKPVTAEFLDEFKLLGRRDFYGRLRDHLKFSSLGGRKVYLEFPYDWRQDIRVTGRRLHEFLQSQRTTIDGRDVVFIAHSMGGLAVRSWYRDYYVQKHDDYGFLRTPRVFFLGTPHFGSASALVELVGGYGSDSGFEAITRYFMKDLNDVSFSFVSIFQLLPFTQFGVTFRSRDGQETAGVDLYSAEIWRECQWGRVLRIRQHVDEREFYENYLPPRLAAAREFRDSMLDSSVESSIPDAVCFFSDGNRETPSVLRIEQTRNGCDLKVARRSPGDGRVIAEYTPFDASPHRHSTVRRLTSDHAALPRDIAFLNYIDEMRTSTLIGAILAATPTNAVYNAFRRAGSLLPVPVDMKTVGGTEAAKILAFNRFVLVAWTGQPLSDATIAHHLYEWAKAAPDNTETALRLYALTVAFDPLGKHAVYAANSASDILLQFDRWHSAAEYSKHALSLLTTVEASDLKFASHVHENAGVAYEKTGEFTEALRQYALAASSDGRRNRINLEQKLRERRMMP